VVLERLGGPRKLKCGFEEAGWAPGRCTVGLERLGGLQEGELWFWRCWVGPRKGKCGFGEAGWALGR